MKQVDAKGVPAPLDEDQHELAVRSFQRRCVAYGTTAITLVVVWALTSGGFNYSSSEGDIRIGWGFWPIWFIVFGALDVARRARKVFGEQDDA